MSDEEDTSPSECESSSEEDENAKDWTPEVDKVFLKTLNSLKSKDPKIYDENVKFFQDEPINLKPDGHSKNSKCEKEQPLTLRDYERKLIVEKGGILEDEDSDVEHVPEHCKTKTYIEEQKALKENFKKLLDDGQDSNETELESFAGFLNVKQKTDQQQKQEEEDYLEWLKGAKTELDDEKMRGELAYLKQYWTDPTLSEGEQFLRDYILNKRYLETESDEEDEGVSKGELLEQLSEEEEMLRKEELYENKYNFRYEEPDAELIKSYPRQIESSLRRKDERRKEKRLAQQEKKKKKISEKRGEVKQLKAAKKLEIQRKLDELRKITGNQALPFGEDELEAEFDGEAWDRKMNEVFDDKFYSGEDGDDSKPVFSDDEGADYGDRGDADAASNNNKKNNAKKPKIEMEFLDEFTDDLIMDCDYDPVAADALKTQSRSARKKGYKKKGKKEEDDESEPPPLVAESEEAQNAIDEYYGLDFEDLAGDVPCRFKYTAVPANDFGLSVEEVLLAEAKELNAWCSMKKIDTFRTEWEERRDQKIFRRRQNDLALKKKLLPSLFKEGEAGEEPREEKIDENILENICDGTKKKRKKRKKKSKEEKRNLKTEEALMEKRMAKKKKAKNISENSKNDSKSLEIVSEKSKTVSEKSKVISDQPIKPDIHSENSKNDSKSHEIVSEKSKLISDQSIKPKIHSEMPKTVSETSVNVSETSNIVSEKSTIDLGKRKIVSENSKSIGKSEPAKVKSLKVKKNLKNSNARNESLINVAKLSLGKIPNNKKNKRKFEHIKNHGNNKKRKTNSENSVEFQLTDDRLKAYGLNPKRFRNKLKYGPAS